MTIDGKSGSVVIEPPEELLRAAHLVCRSVSRFIAARRTVGPLGTYEHMDASHSLLLLLIRHIEATCEIARVDPVLFPAAMSLARSSFEISVRAQWMLMPDDPFAREVHWLTLLREEEGFLEAVLGEESVEARREFRLAVESQLPQTVSRPKARVSFRSMLEDLANDEHYRMYRLLSQYTHGTLHAVNHYQRNLGTAKAFGEWVDASMWRLPLEVCFTSLAQAGNRWLLRAGGQASGFLGHGWESTVLRAISAVGSLPSRRGPEA